MHMYIHMCVHVSVSVCACVFSGLSIWHWSNNGVLSARENHLSCSHLSSVAHSSLCSGEAFWDFPYLHWHAHWCCPFLVHPLGSNVGETL